MHVTEDMRSPWLNTISFYNQNKTEYFINRSAMDITLPINNNLASAFIMINVIFFHSISIINGISILCVTDKSIGDTSDIISDSSGVGTNSDSAVCSIGHPSTTVVCIEPYSSSTIGHLSIQTGEVIEVLGSTDCGLLEGYVRGTNRSGFFPAEVVQEVNIRQKNITNVSTEQRSTFQKRQDMQQQQQQQPPQPPQNHLESFCVSHQLNYFDFSHDFLTFLSLSFII